MTALPQVAADVDEIRRAADVDEIRRAFDLFVEPGGVVELRAPNVDRHSNRTDSGYYDAADPLARDAAPLSGRAPGVYMTMNAIQPALLARAANRKLEYAKTTIADHDVTRSRRAPERLHDYRERSVQETRSGTYGRGCGVLRSMQVHERG